GTYFLKYTYTNGGNETTTSLESAPFLVTVGDIPSVSIPALPNGATGVKLYVTAPDGAAGTEGFYGAFGSAGGLNLNAAVNPANAPPRAAATRVLPPTPPLTSIPGGLGGISVVRVLPTQFSMGNTLDTQILVAATTGGVMLSQDGGRTWTNESLRGGAIVNPG